MLVLPSPKSPSLHYTNLSRITSFLILFLPVTPTILHSQLIAAVFNLFSSSFFKHQHSKPYISTGSTATVQFILLVLVKFRFQGFHYPGIALFQCHFISSEEVKLNPVPPSYLLLTCCTVISATLLSCGNSYFYLLANERIYMRISWFTYCLMMYLKQQLLRPNYIWLPNSK